MKDISVTVSNSVWPEALGLPQVVKGKVMQWTKRPPECQLKISWEEADGSIAWQSNYLHHLLKQDFKLVCGPRPW